MRTALILAGGESRRFGSPKALVEIAGRALIAHVAEVMASLSDETIVSVQTPALEERIQDLLPGVVFVPDARSGHGPIEGFRQGFSKARGDAVLVAPCDAPFLRPQLYRLLLEVLGNGDAAVPKFEVVDPLRAVYRRTSVLEVLGASPNVRSPSELVDRLQAVFVGPDQIRAVDPELSSFVDVNTPEDFDEILRMKRGKD